VLIVPEIHPSIYDIVPSVVKQVARKYKGYAEESDIRQECYAFAAVKYTQHKELLDEPDTEKRKANERRIGWQIKRVAERYARKEKAAKSGYQITDEAYYETTTIAKLLPFVISSIVTGKPLEQGQQMVDDGQPKKQSVPAESGNFLAILIDIKKAYEALEIEDREILSKRYFDNHTLEQMAQYLECAISTADRRIEKSLLKLQDRLGGESPFN
jgi:DNA-directed RNA polymerase specialized sigma24 family protein